MNLSAVIIACNEEKRISACLESVSFCDEIILVDSGSVDETVRIAELYGAKIYRRPLTSFAEQKNYAVSKAGAPWVLSIDADERVTGPLREEILKVTRSPGEDFGAYAIPRHNYLFGRYLKHGLAGGDAPVRLFRKEKARFEGAVHESLGGDFRKGKLRQPLLHYSTETVKEYLGKLNHYARLEAEELRSRGRRVEKWTLLARPPARFFQSYVLRAGVLDGYAGFLYATLSGYYEFVRYAIFWEIFGGFFDRIDRS